MNNEQFERRMEFIIEQQAQFAVDIQQLKEAQADLTRKQDTLTSALATVVGLVGELREAQKRTDEQIATLAASQAETDERLAQTDERLNVLIGVVERYFSRNGQPKSKSRALKTSAKSTQKKSSRKK